MTLTYEQCKSLKDAGFPLEMASQEDANDSKRKDQMFQYGKDSIGRDNTWWLYPTLSELIEACAPRLKRIQVNRSVPAHQIWTATTDDVTGETGSGANPESAVCNLFLALKST